MNPTPENLLAVTAYGGMDHARRVIDAYQLLNERHGMRGKATVDAETDVRCRTCNNEKGKPVPWPCVTYVEMHDALIPNEPMDPRAVDAWRTIGRYQNRERISATRLTKAINTLVALGDEKRTTRQQLELTAD